MLFENKRNEIEAVKMAVRNTLNTLIDVKKIDTKNMTTTKYIALESYVLKIAPELSSIKMDTKNLQQRERANILSIDDLFDQIDSTLDLEFNLNLSKMLENFVFERKQIENSKTESPIEQKQVLPVQNQENNLPAVTDDKKEEKEQVENSADLIALFAAEVSGLKTEDIKKLPIMEAIKSKSDEIDNILNEENIEYFRNIFLSNSLELLKNIKNDLDSVSPKVESDKENKDTKKDKDNKEDKNENKPLIDSDSFQMINILDVPMLPNQFTTKAQCKSYIDAKTERYNQLIDTFNNISDYKKSELGKLKAPIKIDEKSDLKSIISEIKSYGGNKQNTIAQLKSMCIEFLPKFESIIFF